MKSRWPLLLALPIAALAAGCTDEPAREAHRAQPIAGGMTDTVDTNIVSVVLPGGGVCSGSLIAPNLVLTARHCVSYVPDEPVWCQSFTDTDGAVRATTLTEAPYPAGSFLVTTSQSLRRPRDAGADASAPVVHFVSRVIIPADSTGVALCGRDIGLLELADVVPSTEAVPLVPRLDLPPEEGEGYTAIGFGGTDDNGAGLGQRRILGDLSVLAVGQQSVGGNLNVIVQADEEWSGDHGVCGGDSGGPALSLHREVIGSVSRGSSGCATPVYTRVDSFAELIRQTASEAAQNGHYSAPFWVTPNAMSSIPTGGACLTDVDCTDPQARCIFASPEATRRTCLTTDCAHCAPGFVCGSTGTIQACLSTAIPGDGGTGADAGLDGGAHSDAGAVVDAAVFARPNLEARGGCDARPAGGGGGGGGGTAVAGVFAALALWASRRGRGRT